MYLLLRDAVEELEDPPRLVLGGASSGLLFCLCLDEDRLSGESLSPSLLLDAELWDFFTLAGWVFRQSA